MVNKKIQQNRVCYINKNATDSKMYSRDRNRWNAKEK